MKNLVNVGIVLITFIIFGILMLEIEDVIEVKNNRVLLLENVENSPGIQKIYPNIAGDYLVTFDGENNYYSGIFLNPYLSLYDQENGNYGNIKYYKNKSENLYRKLVSENFDEKINEYVKFEKNEMITNISEDEQKYYEASYLDMKKIHNTILNDGAGYQPRDNKKWLKISEKFEYENDKLMNKHINKKMSKTIKNSPQFEANFYSSFFKIYIPRIRCNTKYCVYDAEDIKEITTKVNANIYQKVEYKYNENYFKKAKKLDKKIATSKIDSIEALN